MVQLKLIGRISEDVKDIRYSKFACLQLVFNKLLKVCFESFKKYVDDLMLLGCLKSQSDGILAR